MSEVSLSSFNLPGIGPARARRLEEAGVHTVAALEALGADAIAAMLGMSRAQAQRALDAAALTPAPEASAPEAPAPEAAAAEPEPQQDEGLPVTIEPVETTEPEITVEVVGPTSGDDQTVEAEAVGDSTAPGSGSDDLIARLKNAAAMVSGAVAVVGGGEPGKARKRALKALKKLRKTAEVLAERLVVTAPDDGLSAALVDLLDALEPRLLRLCARPPTRRRLRRARVWARGLRTALRDLMA